MDIEDALLKLEEKLYRLDIQQITIDLVQNASVDIEFPSKSNNYDNTELIEYIKEIDLVLNDFDTSDVYNYNLIKELRELLDNERSF